MVERTSFQRYPETRFAYSIGQNVAPASAHHSPRQNRLLAILPLADYERLLPMLELVPLPLGWTIHDAGDPEKDLYFLIGGIVCRFNTARNGTSTEFAVTGREGVIGISSFLGGESVPSRAVVLSAGDAYRLNGQALKNEFDRGGAMQHVLLRYI